MSKHTPGPWIVWKEGVYAANKDTKASPLSLSSYRGTVCEMDDLDEEIPKRQRIANARLIAAAPDLLEAAKLALKAVPPPGCPNQAELGSCTHCDAQEHAIKTLQAAIAKAEGRP